jgi:hypothetical protein
MAAPVLLLPDPELLPDPVDAAVDGVGADGSELLLCEEDGDADCDPDWDWLCAADTSIAARASAPSACFPLRKPAFFPLAPRNAPPIPDPAPLVLHGTDLH